MDPGLCHCAQVYICVSLAIDEGDFTYPISMLQNNQHFLDLEVNDVNVTSKWNRIEWNGME